MNRIFSGILAFFVSACAGSGPDQALLNQVQSLVHAALETHKVLRLSEIDSVQWTEMVLIRPYTPNESLEPKLSENKRVSATKIEQRDDITVMVFTKGSEVTGVVEFPRAIFDFSQLELKAFRPEDNISLILD